MFTQPEQASLDAIRQKITQLREYLESCHVPRNDDLDEWFRFLAGFARLQGNISNSQGFLATLLAKRYLQNRFPITQFDAAEKAQGATGLDIDLVTNDGRHIIGEIKTTVPYEIARRDLGAQQKTTFRKDFEKLNTTPADYKFFFVTDTDTYDITLKRYASEIPGVEIILLTGSTMPDEPLSLHISIYERLKEAARNEETVPYGEVARMANLNMDLDKDRAELGNILGTISQHEVKQGHPMLSVVAVFADEGVPSDGFYRWAHDLGLYKGHTEMDELEFFAKELKAAHDFWKTH